MTEADNIPFMDLSPLNDTVEIKQAVTEVINSGSFILGPKLDEFEKKSANFAKSRFGIGVGNGFDALVLVMKAFNIKEGDEIVVPAFSFVASWDAVLACGARLVPVDIDPQTRCMNTELVSSVITEKTKAVVHVNMFGLVPNLLELRKFCDEHRILLFEDNAQAFGASYNGRMAGSFGHASATSFYPGKVLGALGDGGCVYTDNHEINSKIRKYRNYGSVQKYQHNEYGVNSRLDEIQAAVLLKKLSNLEEHRSAREKIALEYLNRLPEHDITLPLWEREANQAWHLFVIEIGDRESFQAFMLDRGINTSIHYPYYIASFERFGMDISQFQKSRALSERCVSLPLFVGMTNKQVDLVVEGVHEFFDTKS